MDHPGRRSKEVVLNKGHCGCITVRQHRDPTGDNQESGVILHPGWRAKGVLGKKRLSSRCQQILKEKKDRVIERKLIRTLTTCRWAQNDARRRFPKFERNRRLQQEKYENLRVCQVSIFTTFNSARRVNDRCKIVGVFDRPITNKLPSMHQGKCKGTVAINGDRHVES